MGDAPSQGPAVAGEKELDGLLRHALLIMLRHTRAGRRRMSDRTGPLVEEFYNELTAILSGYGAQHLRVGVAAFYRGEEAVLEYSPREDIVMFRLFQHGVRQLSFHPGLQLEEVVDFCDVLLADFNALEHAEDDVTTLLASKDFEHVSYVVVETFSEGDGDIDPSGRAGDVGAVMAAALAETISGQESEGGGGAANIRFWSADVKFLEQENVAELVAALPRMEGGPGSEELEDEEILMFARELTASLSRCAPWLPWAGLSILRGCDAERVDRLSAILGGQINADIRKSGMKEATDELSVLLQWIQDAKGAPAARVLAAHLFTPLLRENLVAALEDGSIDRAIVLRALTMLPPDQVTQTLRDVCRLAPGPARNSAIRALLGHGQTDLAGVAEIFAFVEGETALALLEPVYGVPVSEDALLFYRAAFSHPEAAVRMRSLAWYAHNAGEQALVPMRAALNDASVEVRTAALYLLLATGLRGARGAMKQWFEGDRYADLELDEKRMGALLFARVAGSAAAPIFRRALDKGGGLLKRRQADETRIASVAALGYLADADSVQNILKMAKKASGDLQQEAQHVARCFEQGTDPYGDPARTLTDKANELGIGPLLAEAPPTPAAADADFMPTMIAPEQSEEVLPTEIAPALEPNAQPEPGAASQRPPGTPSQPPAVDDLNELLDGFAFDDLPSMPGGGSDDG